MRTNYHKIKLLSLFIALLLVTKIIYGCSTKEYIYIRINPATSNTKKVITSKNEIFLLFMDVYDKYKDYKFKGINIEQFNDFESNYDFNMKESCLTILDKGLFYDQALEKFDYPSLTKEIFKNGIIDVTSKRLSKNIDLIIKEKLEKFSIQLNSLYKKIEDEQNIYKKLKLKNERLEKGLPKIVDLDNLNEYYSKRMNSVRKFETVELFETSMGTISFTKSDIKREYIPSTSQLAMIRIGKINSTLNSELIKAWLNDSRRIKEKFGYREISNSTRPSDYGKYTEILLTKGDMYFKIYYQYVRVQGTYGSHSLQYTFYVEIGSFNRKEKANIEKYNQSLGS